MEQKLPHDKLNFVTDCVLLMVGSEFIMLYSITVNLFVD